MRSAPYPFSLPRPAGPALRRGIIVTIVVALHALMLWMLLHLAPRDFVKMAPVGTRTTIELIPDTQEDEASAKAAPPAPAPPRTPPPSPPPPDRPAPDTDARSAAIWSQVIPLSREELAAADISRTPPVERGGDAAQSANAGDTPDAGRAPNGEPMYNAEWYRHPSQAELASYLPANRPPLGWGMIACQTVPDYRVDNCEEIDQSPAGSGLARAVRQAAWQFRVRPPRKGGRPLIGAWVRIRIDYTASPA